MVRQRVQWAVAAAKTAEERQSTISDAAWMLSEIGDSNEAEQLVMTEVSRSQTPYYYMPRLAAFAEQRGDTKTALSWLEKATKQPMHHPRTLPMACSMSTACSG